MRSDVREFKELGFIPATKTTDLYLSACFENSMARVMHDNGAIVMIDPSGGPALHVGDTLCNNNGTPFGVISGISFEPNTGHLINVN